MTTSADISDAETFGLTITRVFDAPLDLVFQMWADTKHMKNWFGPTGMTVVDAGTDFRVGGEWFSHLRAENGGEHRMGGTYKEIVAPERIVFTHMWEGTDAHSGFETIVTVALKDLGGKTELVFHQVAFETASARDSHQDGWNKCLDRLAAALADL